MPSSSSSYIPDTRGATAEDLNRIRGIATRSGFFSSNKGVNPTMAQWNKVFVHYCDGGSFTGTMEEPVEGVYRQGGMVVEG